MGTENTVMAAVLAPGETTITNAASEPHVQDLCSFLVSLGAQHRRASARTRSASRASSGCAAASYRIRPEHIEVGSFIGLAAVTGGEITVEDVEPDDLVSILPAFERLGVARRGRGRRACACPPNQDARDPGRLRRPDPEDRGRALAGVPGRPHVDRASRSRRRREGTILIFEKMFENRLFFVDKLVSMGARIILCDPHRVIVNGPARLYGQRMSSPDIRAGMALLIAALCAEGTSTIGNANEIDRGYERIDERLRGARRVDRAHLGLAARSARQRPAPRATAAATSSTP